MKIHDVFLSVLVAAAVGLPVSAQEPAPAKGLDVELNALAPSQKGCLFTFVAGNRLDTSLSKVSFEFVVFNPKGTVERMVVLDFRDLPQGKTKVRQFDLPGTNCDNVKRLLINDAPVCEGEGVAAGACMTGIVTRSSTQAAFEG
ncbi:hypothetical protein LXM94_24480 [Rhizobium sp. TRM95111]|uniref:hypothetical protein n=1 Tax=Rhizobium alarense TaxID=2846851 RepID=UPI001F17B3FE|nr:hypothetical protein [Rhizobium alarense]MCF3643118.1 hypothetical protein [Rhizobium alarense]